MELLKFINKHNDWEKILSMPPYCLKIKTDGDYKLLKYSQYESDFSLQEVKEARGCIVFYNIARGAWEYVCRPFIKFFNYGEEEAAEIDWSNAITSEKIDGSLMKMWWHCGEWHLSTNGSIDAFKVAPEESKVSFGELFERAIGMSYKKFGILLNKDWTWLFELTTAENHLVVNYAEDTIWYLTHINTLTGFERMYCDAPIRDIVKMPEFYDIQSFDEALDLLDFLDDKEGVVVWDTNNRIKMKTQDYLNKFFYLIIMGKLSTKKIFEMAENHSLDDFIAYFPEAKERIDNTMRVLRNLEASYEAEWILASADLNCLSNKKEFFNRVKNNPYSAYLLKKYDNPLITSRDFLRKMYVYNKPNFLKLIKEELNK